MAGVISADRAVQNCVQFLRCLHRLRTWHDFRVVWDEARRISIIDNLMAGKHPYGSGHRLRARDWGIGTDWASGLFHIEGDGKESLGG